MNDLVDQLVKDLTQWKIHDLFDGLTKDQIYR